MILKSLTFIICGMSKDPNSHEFTIQDLAIFERSGDLCGPSLHSVYDGQNFFSTSDYKRAFGELVGINYTRGEEPPDGANIYIKKFYSSKFQGNESIREMLKSCQKNFESFPGYRFDSKENEVYLFDDQLCITIDIGKSAILFEAKKDSIIPNLQLEQVILLFEGIERTAKNYKNVHTNDIHLLIEYCRKGKKLCYMEINNYRTLLFAVKK